MVNALVAFVAECPLGWALELALGREVRAGRADVAGIRLVQASTSGGHRADGRLEESLIHLTADASEATPAGGSVSLRYDLDGDDVQVATRDTSAGATRAVAAWFGTPSFTLRAERTGLGVPIVRSAVVQCGGTLEFTSHTKGGTSAPITLPRRGERLRLEVEATRG